MSPFNKKSVPVPTNNPPLANVDTSQLSTAEWEDLEFRIPTTADLESICESVFVLKKPDGGVLLLKTSPKEFYSADHLNRHDNFRYTGPPNTLPDIHSGNLQWIHPVVDRYDDPSH